MTLTLPEIDAGFSARPQSYTEDVIPYLNRWAKAGKRVALVTIVGIDGAAPRPLGAQMAVSEKGETAGYISGGCLEDALTLEAQQCIAQGRNRLIRYGKGSPYFDIKLPCGSGLDLYICQSLTTGDLARMAEMYTRRMPYMWDCDMESGQCRVLPLTASRSLDNPSPETGLRDGRFMRVHTPQLKCIVIGASPAANMLAPMAAAANFQVEMFTPDPERTAANLYAAIDIHPLNRFNTLRDTDAWTAALLAFHDHDLEIPILQSLLDSPCFFIAAIGSRKAHEQRLEVLHNLGLPPGKTARIVSPAGLVGGVKTAPALSLSMLAQVMQAAKEHGFPV
jgi:xanthine dehydrogenase accessory factor